MTQDEQILAALALVEQARKEVAELQSLDLDAAFQTGGPRVYRGSSAKKVQHGVVVIRAKDGFLRAADGETLVTGPMPGAPPDPVTAIDGVDRKLYRTTTPMRAKHQRSMINKIWAYRNFKKCGVCGCFDTYVALKHREYLRRIKAAADVAKARGTLPTPVPEPDLDDTDGIEYWCYQCGATDDVVKKTFQPLPDAKHKQRTCADCGKEIWATRGELMFPTGETDPTNGRPDYRCLGCKTKLEANEKGEK